ncbi:MAG TPA: AAA family ATPase [Cytophagaceae bacterium]|jgi:chromosome partitioning protein|nr:AAA family ATPase [Cytophagaceae bacterium]
MYIDLLLWISGVFIHNILQLHVKRLIMIILVGGIKGGCGKTTVAVNLACYFASNEKDVLLVDADDQQTATDFTDLRNKNHPGLPTYTSIKLNGDSVLTELRKIKEKEIFDHIIIDSGGRDTSSQRAALAVCDIAIIPFNPRVFDVWTIGKVINLVNEIMPFNPALKLFACLNKADPTGIQNMEAIEQIMSHGEFLMIPHKLIMRKSYANCASSGLSILEGEPMDKKANDEFRDFAYFIERIN